MIKGILRFFKSLFNKVFNRNGHRKMEGRMIGLPEFRKIEQDDEDPIRLDFQKEKYVNSRVKTPSGRRAVDIGDSVAVMLRGDNLSHVYKKVAVALNNMGVTVTEKELKGRYEHLNVGMQRMNLGNLVRGSISKTKPKNVVPIN